MGLFDKLKSLVSDDKKDTGTIEIIAPLSGEIVNIEDVPDVVFAEKIVGSSTRPALPVRAYWSPKVAVVKAVIC